MQRPLLVLLVLLLPALSGCILGAKGDLTVSPFSETDWNTNGRFVAFVTYEEPLSIAVTTIDSVTGVAGVVELPAEDAVLLEDGVTYQNRIELHIPDGTWDLIVHVDDRERYRLDDIRIDSIAPQVEGLELSGDADNNGDYLLGQGVTWSDGTVRVLDVGGSMVASDLPVSLEGLSSGVHLYEIIFMDEAGNQASFLVQVQAGAARALPAGQHTFGVVSRYTVQAELWDLSKAHLAASRDDAAALLPEYLDDGYGITPEDPVVQQVVAEVVVAGMTTMEAALALYEWMFDNLEYDEERLASTTLMLPRQVINDTEDPDAEADSQDDSGGDGLADDGNGNGVKGGVCRDLAGTYVSLLRAADVPARLVTGYLGGRVNGFHAWVEFYAGEIDGQDAWVPVDISPIDGNWTDDAGDVDLGPAVMMQSFGIRLPDYLPLRPLLPQEERRGWPTAISVDYTYLQESDPPDVEFEKSTELQHATYGLLCADMAARTRHFENDVADCTGEVAYGMIDGEPRFLLASVQVIDYGVDIRSAPESSSISMEAALPFSDRFGPVIVEHYAYLDPDAGVDGSLNNGLKSNGQPRSSGVASATVSY